MRQAIHILSLLMCTFFCLQFANAQIKDTTLMHLPFKLSAAVERQNTFITSLLVATNKPGLLSVANYLKVTPLKSYKLILPATLNNTRVPSSVYSSPNFYKDPYGLNETWLYYDYDQKRTKGRRALDFIMNASLKVYQNSIQQTR